MLKHMILCFESMVYFYLRVHVFSHISLYSSWYDDLYV